MDLRGSWELKSVSVRGYKKLSRLKSPAGYVCLIRDMDYGSRYKIERMNHPAADFEELTANLPFKTQIAYIARTNDAAACERYLHQRYARHTARGEWFDLNDAQLREIRRLTSSRPRGRDRQREAELDSEEPLPAYSAEQPPVSLKDLISDDYPAAPPRQSPVAAAETAGSNKGCLYFFIGIIGLAVLAAALGPNLMNSISPPPTSTERPTSTRRPTSTKRPTATRAVETTYYVRTRANVRSCPRTSCAVRATFPSGARIQSSRRVQGQRINGNNQWVRFSYQGRTAYIHSGLVSLAQPAVSPTRRPTSTRTPTSTATDTPNPTATDTDVPTATDAPTSTWTPTVTDMPTSTQTPTAADTDVPTATDAPTSTSTWTPTVTDTDTPPTATDTPAPTWTLTSTLTHTPTSTAQPTSTRATSVTMYVRTRGNAGANVRACPRTTCGIVGGLNPGADIQALGRVEGEEVYGNSEWVRFEHSDTVAYVHGSLVSTDRPDN